MKFSVFIAASLDGFIARPDGTLDFLDPMVEPNGDDHGYGEFMKTIDVMVMGRATYDVVMGLVPEWPWRGHRVVVLTHRPLTPRADETTFSGTLVELKAKLEAEGCKRAYLDGGRVIQQGLEADLVDDLLISLVPIRLGDGIPLFGKGRELPLRLVSTKTYPATGMVQLKYERAR